MKVKFVILLLAAVGALKVNTVSDLTSDADKHSKTNNMAAIKSELQKGRNVDPKDVITWQFFDRETTATDDRLIFNTYTRAKRQPANVSTIDWEAVPDEMLQKMIETGHMPHKGISKKVFGTGPWLPKHVPELTQKYMPNGTELHFFMQGSKELDDNV